MLRSEMAHAINALNIAISESHLHEALSGLIDLGMTVAERDSKPAIDQLIRAFYAFDKVAMGFGETERTVISTFGLEDIVNIDWRSKVLLALTSAGRDSLSQLHELLFPTLRLLSTLAGVVPALLNLLQQGTKTEQLEGRGSSKPAEDRITLILFESDNFKSRATRLARSIQSMSDMYSIIAGLQGLSSVDLYVASCDSGSNKIFDFVGVDTAIRELKELILSIWDRVAAFKSYEHSKMLEAFSATLPLISRLSEMENSGALPPETVHMYKKKLLASVDGFLETGSLIPEINEASAVRPENVLIASHQLLLEPPIEDEPKVPNPKRRQSGVRRRRKTPAAKKTGKAQRHE